MSFTAPYKTGLLVVAAAIMQFLVTNNARAHDHKTPIVIETGEGRHVRMARAERGTMAAPCSSRTSREADAISLQPEIEVSQTVSATACGTERVSEAGHAVPVPREPSRIGTVLPQGVKAAHELSHQTSLLGQDALASSPEIKAA